LVSFCVAESDRLFLRTGPSFPIKQIFVRKFFQGPLEGAFPPLFVFFTSPERVSFPRKTFRGIFLTQPSVESPDGEGREAPRSLSAGLQEKILPRVIFAIPTRFEDIHPSRGGLCFMRASMVLSRIVLRLSQEGPHQILGGLSPGTWKASLPVLPLRRGSGP